MFPQAKESKMSHEMLCSPGKVALFNLFTCPLGPLCFAIMQSFCQLECDLMNVISRKQMMNLIYDDILNWRSMKSGEKGNYCLHLFLTAHRRFDLFSFYVKI